MPKRIDVLACHAFDLKKSKYAMRKFIRELELWERMGVKKRLRTKFGIERFKKSI